MIKSSLFIQKANKYDQKITDHLPCNGTWCVMILASVNGLTVDFIMSASCYVTKYEQYEPVHEISNNVAF